MSGTLRVLAAPALPPVGTSAPFGATETKSVLPRKIDPVISDIDITTLKTNLGKLSQGVSELFETSQAQAGFRLKSIEVGVEISAEGGITLIGTLTVAGKAALTLTFEKS